MKILSIDPSTTSCGYAVFDNDVLMEKGVIKPSGATAMKRAEVVANALNFTMVAEQPHLIVCEYPHKGGPGMKAKTITILFHLCGIIHGMAKVGKYPIEFIEPIKWKGNIPKAVHQRRVIPKLEEKYNTILSGESDDIVDAVALGDWYLNR